MAQSIFSDDPIDNSRDAPDQLGREGFVDRIASMLATMRADSSSLVLSLIAPWGAGKTSVLRMLKSSLTSENQDWIVAPFTPWVYADLDSLLAGFFAELRSALPEDVQWNETRKRIGEFGRALSPLGKLVSLVGVDTSAMIDRVAEIVSGDVSVSRTQREAEKALADFNRPILIVMDDLDRLTPDELLLVFKLVRLIGRLPGVYYLLCYDEQTLTDVLLRTPLVGSNAARARAYLEKMVQIRLDLPPLRDDQKSRLVNEGFDTVLERHGLSLTPHETERLSRAYREHLERRLDTPRSIKRLFAQVDVTYGAVAGEVDFVDYFLATCLRTMEPGLATALPGHRNRLTGGSVWDWLAVRQTTPAERLAHWKTVIADVGVDAANQTGILSILALMFPTVEAASRDMEPASWQIDEVGRRKGIGHSDYFDRYFSFAVPDDDMPDSTVNIALRDMAAGRESDATAQLAEQLSDYTERTLRKIGPSESMAQAAQPLLVVLGNLYGRPRAAENQLAGPDWPIVLFTMRLIATLAEDDGVAALRALSDTDGGFALLLRVMDRFSEKAQWTEGREATSLPWFEAALATALELIQTRTTVLAATPVADVAQDELVSLVWIWHRLDADACRLWLRSVTSTGEWLLLDLLAQLVPVGVGGAGRVLDFLDSDSIDRLLGLDYVFDALSGELASEPAAPDLDAATLEAARLRVLWTLHQTRSSLANGSNDEASSNP